MKAENRLLAIIGENPYEELLRNRDEETLAMVRMGGIRPMQRTYVFSSPKGGIHIVEREERLIARGSHIRLIQRATRKVFLQPDDLLIKENGQLRRSNLSTLSTLYGSRMMEKEGVVFHPTAYAAYVEEMYPQLLALLRGEVPTDMAVLSMHRILKKKLFSVEAFVRDQYPHLWRKLALKLVGVHKCALAREYNALARRYPELNRYLTAHCDVHGVPNEYQLRVDTMKICEAYGQRFSFMWSDKRTRDLHDKLYARYAQTVAERDPQPLQIHPDFKWPWSTNNDGETEAWLLRTTGELAAEAIELRHCVAGYAGLVNNGDSIILGLRHKNVRYTAQIQRIPVMMVVHEPGQPAPNIYPFAAQHSGGHVTLRVAQLRGLRNCAAPEELEAWLASMVRDFSQVLEARQLEQGARPWPSTGTVAQPLVQIEEEPLPF